MSTSIPSNLISDLPEYCETLSWKMYRILEDIGANDKLRKQWLDFSNELDILLSVVPDRCILIAGSRSDGTTTHGMNSDVDRLFILNDLPVVTDPADHPSRTCLLMQDATTHPGYCKLQMVENGGPIFGNNVAVTERPPFKIPEMLSLNPDKNNRLVCTFPPGILGGLYHDRHGPALFLNRSEKQALNPGDFVYALQSKSWPRCASEWLTRHRHFSWPTTEMINECSKSGCLFVPVGHPESDEQNKEWRLSLTRQERLLVTSFNSVQLKCYILLKIIKKDLIAPYIPDSLTSYHIKTCMLYLIENTSPEFWREGNLLGCVAASLKLLSYWTEIGYCPNYFIPAENMFDRHVHDNVRQQLHQRLQLLISANFQFLVHIQTERIGTYLQIHCGPSDCTTDRERYLQEVKEKQTHSKSKFRVEKLRNILYAIKHTVKQTLHTDRKISAPSLLKKLNDIRNNRLFSGVTETQTLILPYIELHTMSCLISLEVHERKPSELIWHYLASERWHELSLQTDSFSPKLKQATFMYKLGYYNESLYILSSLSSLERFTFCTHNEEILSHIVSKMDSIQEHSDITTEELLRKYSVPCVEFSPTEKNMVPTALWHERIRAEDQEASLPRDLAGLMHIFFLDWVL